ncbi:MAG: beta-lactamase family protein [Butyrivibrio sp.]|nr:beta-lactamase family protein [Butyrivibrio sp.]
MSKTDRYVGELLLKIVNRETGEISKVNYEPQKPVFPTVIPEETHLPRKSPESCGIKSSFVLKMLKQLASTKGCNLHKFMMVKDGNIISECSFEPFNMDMWHVTFSMCKSITGMAIGMLVDEGKLSVNTRVKDIMGSKMSFKSAVRMRDLTVEHLLTMTSGIEYNEAGAITGNDWRKHFLESTYKFDPGNEFDYNSMNSYMLSAIVSEITGETMFDFLKPRLFDKLGIKRVFWEKCPQNITKGGWGMYMRAEDMAKLGQLYIQKGMWNGERIISEEWINESTKFRVETGKEGSEGYGYQIWTTSDREGAFTFNGMLGQDVFVYPDVNMIIVTNAGNNEIFQKGVMSNIIHKMMGEELEVSDPSIFKSDKELNELKAYCKHLQGRTPDFPTITDGGWNSRRIFIKRGTKHREALNYKLPRATMMNRLGTNTKRFEDKYIRLLKEKIDGKIYELDVKSCGVFPLMMQVFHNNFTSGISKIGFRAGDNDSLFMDIYEGDDVLSIKCGFGGKRADSTIVVNDETYYVSMSSLCTTDENNRLVLKNTIYFLEEATSRIFNIYFDNENGLDGRLDFCSADSIEVRLDETPGKDIIIKSLLDMSSDGNIVSGSGGISGFLIGQLNRYVSNETLIQVVKDSICPILYGKAIVDNENTIEDEAEGDESFDNQNKSGDDLIKDNEYEE